MYIPGKRVSDELIEIFLAALNDDRIKAEVHKQMRTEMDNERMKHLGGPKQQTYESLTSGDVNMQTRMAASGYDIYGRTLISGNKNATNQNVYKKMKNKIKFGRAPQAGFGNRGKFTVA